MPNHSVFFILFATWAPSKIRHSENHVILPKNRILESILSSISWLFFLSFAKFDNIISRRPRFGISRSIWFIAFSCIPSAWCCANLFSSRVSFDSFEILFQGKQVQAIWTSDVSQHIYIWRSKMQYLFLYCYVDKNNIWTNLVDMIEHMDGFPCILIEHNQIVSADMVSMRF